MKTEQIQQTYEVAKARYADLGIDTEAALAALQKISLSLHCWQADDVTGFENQGGDLTGGIQATGNYPGKARNIEELRADILKAKSLIPGKHRLNLHEIYGEFGGEFIDRNRVEPKHFQGWIDWAKQNGMKLDFNSTSFSHPKSGSLSLSNPDPEIRSFWIEHTKRCRAIAEEMGKAQGDPCIMNVWVHDGSKDLTVNRMKYRGAAERLARPDLRAEIRQHEGLHRIEGLRHRAGELHRGFERLLHRLRHLARQDRDPRHGPLPPHGDRRRQALVAAAVHPLR